MNFREYDGDQLERYDSYQPIKSKFMNARERSTEGTHRGLFSH